MNETPLNRLKNAAKGCAANALTRVELSMEESKLKSKYQALGQKLYEAVKNGNFSIVKEDVSVIETIGAIFETKSRIEELEKRLNPSSEGSCEEA